MQARGKAVAREKALQGDVAAAAKAREEAEARLHALRQEVAAVSSERDAALQAVEHASAVNG